MPQEVADAIVNNIKKYQISAVRFIRWGEPTMHPQYLEILRMVKQAGALIHINTNGSLLDEAQIKEMMDMHLDSIKFSFQGADEGTYNEMREGGDYKKLLKTIQLFHSSFRRQGFTFSSSSYEGFNAYESDTFLC